MCSPPVLDRQRRTGHATHAPTGELHRTIHVWFELDGHAESPAFARRARRRHCVAGGPLRGSWRLRFTVWANSEWVLGTFRGIGPERS